MEKINKAILLFSILILAIAITGCDKIKNPTSVTVKNITTPNTYYPPAVENNVTNTTTIVDKPVMAEIKIFNTNGYSSYIHSTGFNMLIDNGNKDDYILAEAKKYSTLEYMFLSSNSYDKIGNTEIMLLKYKPDVYETGIKNPLGQDDYSEVINQLNITWTTLIEPMQIEDDTLKIKILTPYNTGFFSEFDDNSMVFEIKTAKANILLMPTCGKDCRDKIDVSLNNDFVLLPYKGACDKISLIDVLKYSNNATSMPQCNETKSKLETLDYQMISYPITIKVYDDGGISYG